MPKLKAYALQDKDFDTVEANRALGFDTDCRNFGFAVDMLPNLETRHRLFPNNLQKIRALASGGIEVIE
jgi:GTP cyclohydrolase II